MKLQIVAMSHFIKLEPLAKSQMHIYQKKYLFYFYQTNPWKVSLGGTIARLYNDNLASVEITVPPLGIQDKIINVLDNFESICKDLNIGLLAENEARKKQYEYYLLSETKRTIYDALLINPYIKSVEDVEINKDLDKLNITCMVNTKFGDVYVKI